MKDYMEFRAGNLENHWGTVGEDRKITTYWSVAL